MTRSRRTSLTRGYDQRRLNSCDRDARHSVHSVRSRDVDCGTNGSLSARDIRCRSRRTSASGRNTGRTSRRHVRQQRERRLQMLPRLADQLIQRRAQFRRLLAGEHLLHAAAVLLQQLQRHEQLPPRGVERQRRDHLRDALRQAGVAREVIDLVGLLRQRSARRAQTAPTTCR